MTTRQAPPLPSRWNVVCALFECNDRLKMITNFRPPTLALLANAQSILARIFGRASEVEAECRRVFVTGVDGAGKTTMLRSLQLGEIVTTHFSNAIDIEQVKRDRLHFTCFALWHSRWWPLWRHFYDGTHGVFFVVDCADRDRVSQAAAVLAKLLKEEAMANVVLCVIANKQDLPDAMPPCEVADRVGLHALKHLRWCVQGSVATTGEGLVEALDWLEWAVSAPKGIGDTVSKSEAAA